MSNKYTFGKIYKLMTTESNDTYIGSTCLPLKMRLWRHLALSKRISTTNKLYNTMKRIGTKAFKIELIEDYPCNTNKELIEREAYWITECTPSLNTNMLRKYG